MPLTRSKAARVPCNGTLLILPCQNFNRNFKSRRSGGPAASPSQVNHDTLIVSAQGFSFTALTFVNTPRSILDQRPFLARATACSPSKLCAFPRRAQAVQHDCHHVPWCLSQEVYHALARCFWGYMQVVPLMMGRLAAPLGLLPAYGLLAHLPAD